MRPQLLKNLYTNRRGWIVATGKGLNLIDTSLFKNETLIGLNRAYLKDDIHFSYLVSMNHHVEKHYGKEIENYDCIAKFGSRLSCDNCIHLKWGRPPYTFEGDITKSLWQGHTVTFAAMQVAYYLGFKEVYLIGLDHYFDYSTFEGPKDGDKKNVVYSKGEDSNHFIPNYFEKGHSHAKAEPRTTEKAYKVARVYYENQGRILANASVVTALEEIYLPRVDYKEILK